MFKLKIFTDIHCVTKINPLRAGLEVKKCSRVPLVFFFVVVCFLGAVHLIHGYDDNNSLKKLHYKANLSMSSH